MKGIIVNKLNLALISAGLALMPTFAQAAFVSGSTGADGAFAPLVNTQVVLPASGILNYTTVNIPAGVTVSFKKNATNTPIVILASGNITIGGTVWLSGGDGTATGAAGGGVLGDDGIPGTGGPGGYDGGRGAIGTLAGGTAGATGGTGLGSGGGGGGALYSSNYCGGGGGGFGAAGAGSYFAQNYGASYLIYGPGGAAYGSSQLLPLIGGSGGGGGTSNTYSGGGGGGGGGAILIASSGTVNVVGAVYANGGASGVADGANSGGTGGGGSGGAIRIVATTITGNGTINANGGAAGASTISSAYTGGVGGAGRIRLESEVFTRTAAASPAATQGLPGSVFVAGLPTLSITSVGGTAVPAQPTGNSDVTLPATTTNPVTVVFTTTGVPAGNTVKLTLVPAIGSVVTAISPALVGDTTSATSSVSIAIPNGPSTLQATVTYNIVLAMGEALSIYAQGEIVQKITLASTLGSKESTVTLITVSGKEFVVPAAVLAAMPS